MNIELTILDEQERLRQANTFIVWQNSFKPWYRSGL